MSETVDDGRDVRSFDFLGLVVSVTANPEVTRVSDSEGNFIACVGRRLDPDADGDVLSGYAFSYWAGVTKGERSALRVKPPLDAYPLSHRQSSASSVQA